MSCLSADPVGFGPIMGSNLLWHISYHRPYAQSPSTYARWFYLQSLIC